MNLLQVQNVLLSQLSGLFTGLRLVDNEDLKGFVRTIAGGRQEVSVSLVDLEPVFIFSLTMCVRLDEVERIVNRFTGSPAGYHSLSSTSMTQLEYFLTDHDGQKEYRVSSAGDVAAAVRELSAVREKILLFFDKYRDVDALDAAMNSPKGLHFDNSNQPYRAMRGIVLAYLATMGNFEAAVARYQEEVKDCSEEGKAKFDRLVSYLREFGKSPASERFPGSGDRS